MADTYYDKNTISVAISYSRNSNRRDVEQIIGILYDLKRRKSQSRQYKLSLYIDRDNRGGSLFSHRIPKKFREADIIVCLVTPAFLGNKFIYKNERPIIIAKHDQFKDKDVETVVPVVIATTNKQDYIDSWIGSLELTTLPTETLKPINKFPNRSEGRAFVEGGLHKVFLNFQENVVLPRVEQVQKESVDHRNPSLLPWSLVGILSTALIILVYLINTGTFSETSNSVTGDYDQTGFDVSGFDRRGFNRKGYDRYGFDRAGFNEKGRDRSGRDKEGYDRDGFDKRGYDRNGYNEYGLDRRGNGRAIGSGALSPSPISSGGQNGNGGNSPVVVDRPEPSSGGKINGLSRHPRALSVYPYFGKEGYFEYESCQAYNANGYKPCKKNREWYIVNERRGTHHKLKVDERTHKDIFAIRPFLDNTAEVYYHDGRKMYLAFCITLDNAAVICE